MERTKKESKGKYVSMKIMLLLEVRRTQLPKRIKACQSKRNREQFPKGEKAC